MCRLGLSLLVVCLPLAAASNTYGKLPLSFEPNQGQTDARVKFLARASGYTLFVTADEAVFARRDGSVERMKLLGANHKLLFEPLDKQPGISNYFIGNDPSKWRTNIDNYGKVALRDVYPGIDLIFYGNERQLEYDWVVAPGGDPKLIHAKWEGPSQVTKNADGDLVLSASLGVSMIQRKPVILQDGKRIEGGYVVRGREVAFELAKYDVAKPLVIDPVLVYSTYLGGSGSDEGKGIAVDASGNAYVTGSTQSTDFPTTSPLQAGKGGVPRFITSNAFVTKINAAGSAKLYSTYLGGSRSDQGNGIAVDGSGNAYVTGSSLGNFPTTSPLQASFGGGYDAFVTKINAAGSALVYSTYLGGSGIDIGYGIAVDGVGNVYVTGHTTSTNFPTTNPLQGSFGGGSSFGQDAFVTKINAAGSAYAYSTYLGGSGDDIGRGIAVDGSGNAYVTGQTNSTNFPTTNPLQASHGGSFGDAFVTKINAAGSAYVYSTYLGGNGNDVGTGIAVDGSANAYVTGFTQSTNFPTANPLQASNGGGIDAFVTKINAAGSAYVYSTYLGGSGSDQGQGFAVDGAGNAYVTGNTSSTNFPTANPLQASNGGRRQDVFVTKINAAGSALVYSSYLGGSGDDYGQGIAVDGSGNAYVTGYTYSTDFPTTSPLQASNAGGADAFVLSISAPVK
jgi:Beta-propeller repeat